MVFLPLLSALTILLASSKSEIRINNNVNSVENNISVSTSSNSNTKVSINNDKFEIEGKVDSITSNTLTVNGQSISIANINLANIATGNQVKVKGTIKSGVLYLENIEKIGEGTSGESKIEIKQDTGKTLTVTRTPISVTPTTEPTISADIKIEDETTKSANIIVKILLQVFKALQNIF